MIIDPWIRRQRRMISIISIVMALASLCWLCMLGLVLLTDSHLSWNSFSPFLQLGFYGIILTFGLILEKRSLQYRLYQHARIQLGDPDVLVPKQPAPNRYALWPSTVIHLRRKKGMAIFLFGITTFMTLLFAGGAAWLVFLAVTPTDTSALYFLLACLAGLMALVFGALLWLQYRMSRFWVKVTEAGLEACFGLRHTWISWSEARFFCVNGTLGLERQRVYTLAGENQSVSWMQLMTAEGVPLYRSALPFERYEYQSQALLETVVGHTGLPLYDMRLPAEVRTLFARRSHGN